MMFFTLAGAQFGKNKLLTAMMIGLYVLVLFLLGMKMRNKWLKE